MPIHRRTLLIGSAQLGAAAGAAAMLGGLPTPASAAPKDLWQEFTDNPFDHPQVPNVAYAGYRTGESLPRREVRANVLKYGARNDGSADASAAINKAIADVGAKGGGAVLLPAGRYRIDHIIQLGHSNVTLRGEGSGRTTLHAPHSLEGIVGKNRDRYGSSTKSAWSWSGGLVWVCHRDRLHDLIDAIRHRRWPDEGWTGNKGDKDEVITTISADASRGAFSITVADGGKLRPAQRVLLQLSDDREHSLLKHMCGDIPGTAKYPWAKKTKLLSLTPFVWPVRIAKVNGDRITLAQPLPLAVRRDWKPRLTTMCPVVTDSGVEGLTIEMAKTERPKHLEDKGFNGLAFQCAWDCWADDVRVVNSDNGILLVSAKGITVQRTRISGRGQHHSYACRQQSHDNLFDDFIIDEFTTKPTPGSIHHGIDVEGLSCGNVWSRGQMAAGTFDTHRALPFGNVRTEITINNNGLHGGSDDAGPLYGARFTHWNIEVTNKRAGCVKIDDVAPYSATVGISKVTNSGQTDRPDFSGPLRSRLESYGDTSVTPANLYVAQRDLRHRRNG
ncbi:glycosyl hydrolase family 28-related protein [Streptomyces cucumeris]|uniref:glycosyl hydrolase family 28-related protein n=1 Tax=Streptomyces cucumeris TaxID=2962890 RepID=UPI003EBA0DB8